MMIIIVAIFTLYSILAWRNLRAALILLCGLLPLYLIRFSLGPIPFTALEGVILIAFFIWLVRKKAWKLDYRSFGPIMRPILLLLAAACFAVIVAEDTFSALGIWKAYFIEPALVFLMLRSTMKQKQDWTNALKALALSGTIVAAIALVQFITGQGIPVPWDIERRVTGVFNYPNALGLFLTPIVTASAVMLAKTWNQLKIQRLFWITTLIFGLSAIILAKTEAAFIAIPAALFVTYTFSSASKAKKIGAGVVAPVIIVSSLFITPVREKLFLQDYSGQVRISQWTETVELLKDNVIFGVGLNQYPNALIPYHDPSLYEIFQYPHNIILNIWVELGLLGLITFTWLAWRVVKEVRIKKENTLALAAFSALLAMSIHGLVDVPFFKNDLAVMTFFFLAIVSAQNLQASPVQKST